MSNRIIAIYCLSFLMGVLCSHRDDITDFTGCKVHVSRSESKYNVFYKIERDVESDDEGLVFDLHFWVLASNDAHVLVAESDNVSYSDAVYEIVLGAGDNSFSEIRRQQRSNWKRHVRTINLLSSIDFQPFWIHIWKDGLIEVYNKYDDTILMAWKDPEPLQLKYFSFSTWQNVNAKWFFDCPKTTNKDNPLNNELVLPISDGKQLQRDLFQNYSVLHRPVLNELDMTDVLLQLAPQYVSLDESSSKLLLKGRGNMKWIDEKLKWNADDYDGIRSLKLSADEIWTPDLRLYEQKVKLQEVILYSNGSVFSNIFLDTSYWCNIENLDSWPSDTHNCSLQFNFIADGEKIRLLYLSDTEDFFQLPLASEWIVTNVDVKYGLELEDEKPPGIVLTLTLQRLSDVYRLIFLTPFFVINICCLCTFWISPFGCQKIFLCCLQLIIESVILTYISTILPGHSIRVPTLIRLYSGSLICTAISVIISVLVINLSRNKHQDPIPQIMFKTLTSKVLKYSLFLPDVNNRSDERRKSMKGEDSIQEMWILFGTAIDRITFIIYLILSIFVVSTI